MSLIDRVIDLAQLPADRLPQRAMSLARLSLLDWMACGIAGTEEPLAVKLRMLADLEAGRGVASVVGDGMAPARMAALVNGATSHALDYDDTHFAHIGHLSVAIYPAALAVAEEIDAPAEAMVEAFLVGAEAAIWIGIVLGRAHYNLGFHQTATAGAFGATVAAGRLYGLSREQLRNAIGLCSTRASGLKSQFGTMGKPYNAGVAASNGVECAKLASLGMTSSDDGLEGMQGFITTHSPAAEQAAGDRSIESFIFEDNKYKLHACCHGTHAMIEALLSADALKGQSLNDVAALVLRTNPRWLKVCDIKRPRTGLEVKFSYNWLAGMTIRGDRTGDDRIYQDSLSDDGALSAFANKVEVIEDDALTDMQARGVLTLKDGAKIKLYHDLDAELPQHVLAGKLRAKAEALIGARGAGLWQAFADLTGKSAREVGSAFRK
ncbi:MAG: MmgE/PrpD family protein [Mesorhizobium sp.]|nr:MmgE/PrpD family protein [Mesorhizobium sp.]MBL8580301.1 MmgE/PrpD family protein [Mesorhizobium sp.]